jgi:hypothetical protein
MSDRTPLEIAALEREIAEKLMGRRQQYGVPGTPMEREWFWTDASGTLIKHSGWSPWENLTDAREVLKRLVEILASEQEGPEPPAWTIVCYKWGAAMRHLVSVGAVSAYHDDGPHEGPAICLLARKVMEGK